MSLRPQGGSLRRGTQSPQLDWRSEKTDCVSLRLAEDKTVSYRSFLKIGQVSFRHICPFGFILPEDTCPLRVGFPEDRLDLPRNVALLIDGTFVLHTVAPCGAQTTLSGHHLSDFDERNALRISQCFSLKDRGRGGRRPGLAKDGGYCPHNPLLNNISWVPSWVLQKAQGPHRAPYFPMSNGENHRHIHKTHPPF